MDTGNDLVVTTVQLTSTPKPRSPTPINPTDLVTKDMDETREISALREELEVLRKEQISKESALHEEVEQLREALRRHEEHSPHPDPIPKPKVPLPIPTLPSPPLPNKGSNLNLPPPKLEPGGRLSHHLLLCKIFFESTGEISDKTKVAHLIYGLSGPAKLFALEILKKANSISYEDLSLRLLEAFDPHPDLPDFSSNLGILQGRRSVRDYTQEFRTAHVNSQHNDYTLRQAFLDGLRPNIATHVLGQHTHLENLDAAICASLRYDHVLSSISQRRSPPAQITYPPTRYSIPTQPPTPVPNASSTTPPGAGFTSVFRSPLAEEEKDRRKLAGLCVYCGDSTHLIGTCPALIKQRQKPKPPSFNLLTESPPKTESTHLEASVRWGSRHTSIPLLFDCGAHGNFLPRSAVDILGVATTPLPSVRRFLCANGTYLFCSSETDPVEVILSGNHREFLKLLVPDGQSTLPLVLGLPWLSRHQPSLHYSLEGSKISSWSPSCHATCLRTAFSPSSPTSSEPCPPTPLESIDLSLVPVDYHDLAAAFSKDRALSLPPHRAYDCTIKMREGLPWPSARLYNLSQPEKIAMEKYVNDSLQAGIIRQSSSPLAAGAFFVAKKDGSLRPCIDYRGLNNITIKDKYPLPLIDSAFNPLHSASVFSKLDLRNAYHLVRIRKGDEWKTAFKTSLGHFEYLVMPFGLTNAPAIFQALLNDVLRDMLGHFVFVYLDDILIYSESLTEHTQHVRMVLQRLLDNKLFVKAEKCEFHKDTISFLGFIVAKGELRMDPAKVSAVADWPVPTSRKDLQRFLGFANFYRRFIKDYSMIAQPLTALTSSSVPFSWPERAVEAFNFLKSKFSSAPFLRHADPTLQFIVEVDASDSGVGAVLSQVSPTDKFPRPCSFFSRRLSPAEKNYDVGNRELLAIVLALETWRHHLQGAPVPFLVRTDHKNLAFLRSAKQLNPRQSRWALFLASFDFTIEYRPGSDNVAADALSRQFCGENVRPEESLILSPDVFTTPPSNISSADPPSDSAATHSFFAALPPPDIEPLIISAQVTEPDPRPSPSDKIFVPKAVRPQVLEWAHSSRLFGHPGLNRSLTLVRSRFWWPSLTRDTKAFVSTCPVCARNKTSTRRPAGLLHPLPIPSRPWSDIAVDFVTGLPPSAGKTVILTVIDRFSKSCHLIALPKLPSARETADALVSHVYRLHGTPESIVSDRGPQFISKIWKAFCRALNCSACLSSGFHPQSNGQNERLNQEIEATLRCLTSSNPKAWAPLLPWVEYAHNSLVNASTGLSPFMCSLGYQPPLLSSDHAQVKVPSVQAHIERCHRIWQKTQESLVRASKRSEIQANRRRSPAPNYTAGQMVLLNTKTLNLKDERRKLAPRFVGPFKITDVYNEAVVRLALPPSYRCWPVFHVSYVKPWSHRCLEPTLNESEQTPNSDDADTSTTITGHPPTPTPASSDPLPDADIRQILRLLRVRGSFRKPQYLAVLRSDPSAKPIWLPQEAIPPQIITDFEASRPTTTMVTRGRLRRREGTVNVTTTSPPTL